MNKPKTPAETVESSLQLAWHPTPAADDIALSLLANPRLDQILGITRFDPAELGRQLWHVASQIVAGWESAQLNQEPRA